MPLPLPMRTRASQAALAIATLGASLFSAPAASAAPVPPIIEHPQRSAAALQCTPGLSSTLAVDSSGEKAMELPASIDYSGGAASEPGGQGSNPSSLGYKIQVTSPTGASSVRFGADYTDATQGVPWAMDDASVSHGGVPSWGLDAQKTGRYTVTITYDRPVYGMRTAVTDLDTANEKMTLNAYAEQAGGTAVPLDVQTLDNPSSIPSLGPTQTHTGNTAYIQDGRRVRDDGGNTFSSLGGGGVSSPVGSVYFAFDSNAPIQRVEMTYEANAGTGFWFVPPSVPQACVQPNIAIGEVGEGGTATLSSTLANQAGSGRIEDIGFVYELPDGVFVADDPKLVAEECAGTVIAEPGSSRITVTGAYVAAGATTCDFSVDLVFTRAGEVTFDGSIISGASNLVPGNTTPTTVTVAPDSPALTADLAVVPLEIGDRAPQSGDEVRFRSTVTNTGNTSLTAVDALDALGTSPVCAELPIPVGGSAVCVSTTPYVLTQADVDGGSVENELAASGTSATGKRASAPAARAQLPIASAPLIVSGLSGELHAGATVRPGDTATFRSTVTNGGNVTISTLGLTDELGTMMTCDAGQIAPGASAECASSAPYVLTQVDIDAGSIRNGASASGTDPAGRPVISQAKAFTIVLDGEASATSTLALRPSAGTVGVGTEVSSVLTVTNTGTVTLSGARLAGSLGTVFGCPAAVAPGESIECTSTAPHVVTQADVDAGVVTDVATGSMLNPSGAAVEVPRAEASLKIAASGAVAAEVIGTITSEHLDVVRAGDRIVYTGTVTNVGNVTVRSLSLTDGDLSCDATQLAPGESTDCRAEAHTLSQADIDAGAVKSSFTVVAVAANGDAVEAKQSTVRTPLEAAPQIGAEIEGELESEDPGRPEAGDAVSYIATVRNTGNVTLHGVSLVGSLGTSFECEQEIAPGDTLRCEGDVPAELAQADLDAGMLVNTVSGNATQPSGDAIKIPAADVRTQLQAAPSLEVAASTTVRNAAGDAPVLFGTALIVPGDSLLYSMTVTNTGNVTISDLMIDERPSTAVGCSDASIAPGERMVCTSATPFVISDAALSAGQIAHTAFAEGAMPTPVGGAVIGAASRAAHDDQPGMRVRSEDVTTITWLVRVPGVLVPPVLAATGASGVLGTTGVGALALLAGVGGLMIAKRRARARDEGAQTTPI